MHDFSAYPEHIRAALASQFELSRYLSSQQMQEWAHLDLTMGQLKTLMVLAGCHDLTVSRVAEALSLGKPATSILVDRLVQLQLVQRTEDPQDRRRTLVTLTEEGRTLTARLRQGSIDLIARLVAALDPADLAAWERGLNALLAVIQATNADSESRQGGATLVPAAENPIRHQKAGA